MELVTTDAEAVYLPLSGAKEEAKTAGSGLGDEEEDTDAEGDNDAEGDDNDDLLGACNTQNNVPHADPFEMEVVEAEGVVASGEGEDEREVRGN